MNIKLYIWYDCRRGFDIELSGGARCPECGGNKWKAISRLPEFADKYRYEWAKDYGVFVLNEGEGPEAYKGTEGGSSEGGAETETATGSTS